MLKVENLVVKYGEAIALKEINLEIKANEIVAVIGSNGAGKTTLLNAIMNRVKKSKGRVFFKNIEITNLKTHKIANLGISYLPDKRTVIKELTVKDNLMIAGYNQIKTKGFTYFNDKLEALFEHFPNIKTKIKQKAGLLSGGEQQMLSLAQALLREPELIILDEPTAGLSPKLVKTVFEIISFIKKNGLSILIVEQNVNKTIDAADEVYILKNGKITDKGKSKEFKDGFRLKQAYFGG
ncbi:ABC transporter ATP-binding protein [Hippea alviniae]|uniref:ABC transporter ATP-binding protein n=1 Tax=Hippea alviniae TaxID=1279027 RepID=UPI0003B34486|nr:ABC transporter ATP-binding protein [Hippea alviniae]